MKKMLHFFSRPGEERNDGNTAYLFREPTLDPSPIIGAAAAKPQLDQASRPSHGDAVPAPHDGVTAREDAPATAAAPPAMPADYAGIVAFFEKTVLERKSPYSALVKAADKLKEYVPNEISRLKAAYALCGEQWPPDVLSFAIGTHIADIDHAREKARHNRHDAAAGQAAELRRRAEHIRQENAALEQELAELHAGVARVESALHDKRAALASLNEQIQQADNDANAMCFVDQAAENMKNDLLAKKVILGLP
jgi:hypothetical protein